MKRVLRWALLPSTFAVIGAVAPLRVSASSSSLIKVTDAVCEDCMAKVNYTCGTPPLDRVDYCTAGAPWCG